MATFTDMLDRDAPLVYPANGTHITIVAPDRDPGEPIVDEGVVGRVEADPPMRPELGLTPRVRGLGPQHRAFLAAEDVTAHVARRDPVVATERHQHVSVVLANAGARADRFVDRGLDARRFAVVAERVIDRRAGVQKPRDEIVTARIADLDGKRAQFGTEDDVLALVQFIVKPAYVRITR